MELPCPNEPDYVNCTGLNTYEDWMISLAVLFARMYQRDKKAFIGAYVNCPSIQNNCRNIVSVYKKTGLLDQCQGDFSGWASKQKVADQDLLATTMKILFNLIK